jgi:putative membrane protein
MAGAVAAACMTIIRMAARRRGIIEKTVPQAVEEWLAARAGVGAGSHPIAHHLTDQILHFGYGAALGSCYGLTVRGRTRTTLARGAGYGLATWIFGSCFVMPLIRAKQAPWHKRASENAVDVIAHVAFGMATALVAEELSVQSNRGPSSDTYRRAIKVG